MQIARTVWMTFLRGSGWVLLQLIAGVIALLILATIPAGPGLLVGGILMLINGNLWGFAIAYLGIACLNFWTDTLFNTPKQKVRQPCKA